MPPHQRAAGGGVAGMSTAGGGPKPQFSLAFDANDRPGKVTAAAAARPTSSQPQQPTLPPGAFRLFDPSISHLPVSLRITLLFRTISSSGAEFVAPSKTAAKNAKKRAANKKKEGEGDEECDTPTAAVTGSVASLSIQQQQQQQQQDEAQAAVSEDPVKRIRAIQKKLRQVRA